MGNTAANKAVAYDWAGMLKSEVASTTVEASKPKGPITSGKHNARIAAIKFLTFKTGSYGIQLTYALESEGFVGRTINENLVLVKADGTKAQYGDLNVKRRLMAVLTPDQLKKFKQPKSEQDLGDFRLLFNAPVTVNIKDDGEYEGRPSRKVSAVYARNED